MCIRDRRTCVQKAGISIVDAVRMMTETPAKNMGLSHVGKLAEGYDADILVFDQDINIQQVILSGDSVG